MPVSTSVTPLLSVKGKQAAKKRLKTGREEEEEEETEVERMGD